MRQRGNLPELRAAGIGRRRTGARPRRWLRAALLLALLAAAGVCVWALVR
jgi:hypothetical protein